MIYLEETGMEDVQVLMEYLLSNQWKRDGLMAGARFLRTQLLWYPQAKPRPNPALTRKQRIYLAIAVREGRITIPYRRSFGMRRQWKITRENGLSVVVHNDTNAAKWTMGQRRTAFHKGTGWRNMGESWQRYGRRTITAIEDEISQLIEARNRTRGTFS